MRRAQTPLPFLLSILLLALVACGTNAHPTPSATPNLTPELVVYGWGEDIPQSILETFTTEYGVKITYLAYASQDEAIEEIRAGEVYDVVFMESHFLPLLAEAGLLAKIDLGNVPNFQNISVNFRDLAYDPGNLYSVPSTWGTTGLLVRTDLVAEPVTRWADLWDQRYAGKVAVWVDEPREVIGLTLVSLGYSVNSESPDELEAALQRLLELKPGLIFLSELESVESTSLLADGTVVIAMGYPGNMVEVRAMKLSSVHYVFPEEGTLMWSDSLIIPANSPNKRTAELFINFLLRPDISAQITNLSSFATPNEAARPFIDPVLLNDPVIFPPVEVLRNGQIVLSLSAKGQELYQDIWERFMASQP